MLGAYFEAALAICLLVRVASNLFSVPGIGTLRLTFSVSKQFECCTELSYSLYYCCVMIEIYGSLVVTYASVFRATLKMVPADSSETSLNLHRLDHV